MEQVRIVDPTRMLIVNANGPVSVVRRDDNNIVVTFTQISPRIDGGTGGHHRTTFDAVVAARLEIPMNRLNSLVDLVKQAQKLSTAGTA